MESTKFVPSSAFAAIDLKPKAMLAEPAMELIPHEIIKVFGEKELELDLLEITRITLLIGELDSEDASNPPEAGAVIRFATPQTISDKIMDEMVEQEPVGNTKCYSNTRENMSFVIADDKTFILGSSEFVRKMLVAKGADSRLIKLMTNANPSDHINTFMVMEPVRDIIKTNLPPRDQLPPPLRDFLDLPDLIDTFTTRFDISKNNVSSFTIGAVDEKATEKIQRLIAHGFSLGKNAALSFLSMEANIPPDYEDSVMAYAERVATFLETAIEPVLDGNQLTFDLNQNKLGGANATSVATIGILVGMLLPAVQQVREAARRTTSLNQLRQMMLACHNYESANGHFPKDICDENGNSLLSWRVAILPYMEQNALYEQFRLDEGWDSPHNAKLVEQMPETYFSPNVEDLPEGCTIFLGVAGERSMFQANKEVGFSQVIDGTSNTIGIIEADAIRGVAWSRPADWKFDPDNPMAGVGGLRPAVINCALIDGSVQSVAKTIDKELWSNLVQINDGNID